MKKSRNQITIEYLVEVLDGLQQDFGIINSNYLSSNVNDYSLDKIPTNIEAEPPTITGIRKLKDVNNFRGRFSYSSDVADNLSNMGFWEAFQEKIYSNNSKGILPNIDGIYEIKCLNCGSLQRADTQTCEMSIQIEIDYEKKED